MHAVGLGQRRRGEKVRDAADALEVEHEVFRDAKVEQLLEMVDAIHVLARPDRYWRLSRECAKTVVVLVLDGILEPEDFEPFKPLGQTRRGPPVIRLGGIYDEGRIGP